MEKEKTLETIKKVEIEEFVQLLWRYGSSIFI
jgi:hypothetical protein